MKADVLFFHREGIGDDPFGDWCLLIEGSKYNEVTPTLFFTILVGDSQETVSVPDAWEVLQPILDWVGDDRFKKGYQAGREDLAAELREAGIL